MKADPTAQLRLLDLQAEDTAIAQLEHRRRSLPEHAALADARITRAHLGEDLVAVRTRVGDLQLDVEKAESDLVPVREAPGTRPAAGGRGGWSRTRSS